MQHKERVRSLCGREQLPAQWDLLVPNERGHSPCQALLTGPVLEAEAVPGDLPHGVGGGGLCRQQEVLIEVALLIPVKFDSPTCHHEDCCLALSSLFFTRRYEMMKKTTQTKTSR